MLLLRYILIQSHSFNIFPELKGSKLEKSIDFGEGSRHKPITSSTTNYSFMNQAVGGINLFRHFVVTSHFTPF